MYDPTTIMDDPIQQVRFLLGGDKVDALTVDDEISFALSKENNIFNAAAMIAEQIAGQKTLTAYSKTVGPLTYDGKTARDSWLDLAKSLRTRGVRFTALSSDMLQGVSNADKADQTIQDDYPQFYFSSGVTDNRETQPEPQNRQYFI